ncbi:MAG TPA: hypothetical protein VNQ90_15280 [Chthoniobacteraceae bacterium]|nr:hypothetical protein [Chthoniobacteraceae bacterium]
MTTLRPATAFDLAARAAARWQRIGCCLLLLLGGALPVQSGPSAARATADGPHLGRTGFDPRRDAFAFANDTVREYLTDENGEIISRRRDREPNFAHACFLLCRATLQFAKFARFEPGQPRLTQREYARVLKRLFRIPTWYSGARRSVAIPGYGNLWDFSADHKALLQETLGSWRLTYLRFGNFRVGLFVFPRRGQELAKERIIRALDRGELQAVYLTRFPKMNHAIVIYGYKHLAGGNVEFLTYDPNYPGRSTWLRYIDKERSFDLEERWYFNKGRVNLMRIYISPFH